MSEQKTGWWNPNPFSNRKKHTFHFVGKSGLTLCGNYRYIQGDVEEGQDDHHENCKACQKNKLTLNKKETK